MTKEAISTPTIDLSQEVQSFEEKIEETIAPLFQGIEFQDVGTESSSGPQSLEEHPLKGLFEQGLDDKQSPVGKPREERVKEGVWYEGIFQDVFVPFEELERIGLTAPVRRDLSDRSILHVVFTNRLAKRNGSGNPI